MYPSNGSWSLQNNLNKMFLQDWNLWSATHRTIFVRLTRHYICSTFGRHSPQDMSHLVMFHSALIIKGAHWYLFWLALQPKIGEWTVSGWSWRRCEGTWCWRRLAGPEKDINSFRNGRERIALRAGFEDLPLWPVTEAPPDHILWEFDFRFFELSTIRCNVGLPKLFGCPGGCQCTAWVQKIG